MFVLALTLNLLCRAVFVSCFLVSCPVPPISDTVHLDIYSSPYILVLGLCVRCEICQPKLMNWFLDIKAEAFQAGSICCCMPKTKTQVRQLTRIAESHADACVLSSQNA